jgi:cytochrome P450 family 135
MAQQRIKDANDGRAGEQRRLPPGPRAPATWQSLQWVLRPVRFMESCRRRFGDTFTLKLGPLADVVFLTEPESIKAAYAAPPDVAHAGDINGLFRPILGSHSLLLLDGDEHLRQRKLMLPPFHGRRIERWGHVMREVAAADVVDWPFNRPFGLEEHMQQITLRVILHTVFGIEDGPRLERLRRLVNLQLELSRSYSTMLPQLRRELGGHSPWGKLMRCIREVDDALYAEIGRRRHAADLADREDVLSLLLVARDEDGAGMSDVEVRDQLLTLLVAGHETSATQLAWTFERLLRHPEALARVHAEIEEGGYEYTDAAIRESLRLRPVLPISARKLTGPFAIGDWRFPGGTVLMCCAYLANRNPDVYSDPEAFRPERFLEDEVPAYAWIPCGGGVRRCLGASFATFEMRVVLQTLLARAVLRPASPRAEGVMRRSFTFAPDRDCQVVLEERRRPPALAARPERARDAVT